MGEFVSFRETVQILQDFLEVAFPTILHQRKIYSRDLFEAKKKYNVPVWQSRHPDLHEYIATCTSAIGEQLAKGNLKKVAFIVKEANLEQQPLERFIFDFTWLIAANDIAGANGQNFRPESGGLVRSHVDEHLRAFMIKLATSDSYLLPLPPLTTFTIVMELTDDAAPPESIAETKENLPSQWIPAQSRYTSTPQEFDAGGKLADAPRQRSVAPLNSARLGLINVQLLVEEFEGKFDLHKQRSQT